MGWFRCLLVGFCLLWTSAQAQHAFVGRAGQALTDQMIADEFAKELEAITARNGQDGTPATSGQEIYHSRLDVRDQFIKRLMDILAGPQPSRFSRTARREWTAQVEELTERLQALALMSPPNAPAGRSVVGDNQNPYKHQMRKLADLFVYNVILAANANAAGDTVQAKFRSESAVRVLIESWLISGMNKSSITAMVNASRLALTAFGIFFGGLSLASGHVDLLIFENIFRYLTLGTGVLAWRDFRRGTELVDPPDEEDIDTSQPHRATYRPSLMLGFQRRWAINSEARRGMWAFWYEVRIGLRAAAANGGLNSEAAQSLKLSELTRFRMSDSSGMSGHLIQVLSGFAGEDMTPLMLAKESCEEALSTPLTATSANAD